MAESLTADQVREAQLRTLGPTLGPLYSALYKEVTLLHIKWKQYRTLFAESTERLELLNRTARSFFWVVQRALRDDIVLHIARLTDPPKSMGRNNLTLLKFDEAVLEPTTLSEEISSLVQRVRTEAQFARDWRNRQLAHRDLDLSLNEGAQPLEGISRESVERVLAAIRDLLNKVEGHFSNSRIKFMHTIVPNDAEDLVYYLKSAIDAEMKKRTP